VSPTDAETRSDAEALRLKADARREANWKRWGPYLSERQWGTVREDYSPDNESWDYFPHDHARSRVYRWGEDGLLGICDRQCRMCFSIALHNGADPILKERLFGLTGPQGNHGEDVKELYYYLDATPTSSYLEALYKYPQRPYPYRELLEEARRRGKTDLEHELLDSGIFDDGRYFDVRAQYAKAGPEDILVRIRIRNHADAEAAITVLPTLWFRNNWSWGRTGEGYGPRPEMRVVDGGVVAKHVTLGHYRLDAAPVAGVAPELLLTDNETNVNKLFGTEPSPAHAKDAFHDYVVDGRREVLRTEGAGTKAAARYDLRIGAHGEVVLELRLRKVEPAAPPPFADFADRFAERKAEADAFYAARLPANLDEDERLVARQAYAGLLWTKQFYHYAVKEWLEGDPGQPPAPESRYRGRNRTFTHLYNRDIISMPDKWEYPWYAAWDLAFHMLPMARVDHDFAKQQLILFLREWYMHPNGQIPAYEFALDDVNPPVHAWAVWRIYKMSGVRGERDVSFLARCFHKLLLNFTWWVNRTDDDDNNLFAGGFLGLDNIGVFDRSKHLPGQLEQADGTAWMAFYCGTMLSMALELADHDPSYEDVASKFLEHFVAIADAMNAVGGCGLWDEEDGFYYDQLHIETSEGERTVVMKVRSMVGLIPLIACELLADDVTDRMSGFTKRMRWFVEHRADLAQHITYLEEDAGHRHHLLAIPSKERLVRVLGYMLDENEFLSPHGIRALSRYHLDHPFELNLGGEKHVVRYTPAESDSYMFGGNSNWRGPVWLPVNFLLIEALERYHHFYGDALEVECPTGSGNMMNLRDVAHEIARRLCTLFVADEEGVRPCHGSDARYANDPAFRDLVLFYEYFDGDNGRGCGASHQTGWTALVAQCLEMVAEQRAIDDRA
jgi:Mannosylglycerate hydrolase MGH1-like glycoside hydrolase domain